MSKSWGKYPYLAEGVFRKLTIEDMYNRYEAAIRHIEQLQQQVERGLTLPKITEDVYVQFGDCGQLIEDGNWSQDAVDFVAFLNRVAINNDQP